MKAAGEAAGLPTGRVGRTRVTAASFARDVMVVDTGQDGEGSRNCIEQHDGNSV